MDWTAIPPPLIAASAGLFGVLVGSGISAWTTRSTHKERLAADQALADRKIAADVELAERKFDFDRSLAERKVGLETAIAEKKIAFDRAFLAWKRKAEFAEEVLADFYEARDIINNVRSPLVLAGEGATREPRPGETEEDTRRLNGIYATLERLKARDEFFARLHARRYRFAAYFGRGATTPYDELLQYHHRIALTARMLLDTYQDRNEGNLKAERIAWRKIVWWWGPEDPMPGELDNIIAQIQVVCSAAIVAGEP